ncbi:hypothetical protein LINGRAHAP2_LOCUS22438 [Linum grandiflorum]
MKIQMQLDLCAAIQLLLAEGEITHQHSSKVVSSRQLLDRDWLIKVEHIYRGGGSWS